MRGNVRLSRTLTYLPFEISCQQVSVATQTSITDYNTTVEILRPLQVFPLKTTAKTEPVLVGLFQVYNHNADTTEQVICATNANYSSKEHKTILVKDNRSNEDLNKFYAVIVHCNPSLLYIDSPNFFNGNIDNIAQVMLVLDEDISIKLVKHRVVTNDLYAFDKEPHKGQNVIEIANRPNGKMQMCLNIQVILDYVRDIYDKFPTPVHKRDFLRDLSSSCGVYITFNNTEKVSVIELDIDEYLIKPIEVAN
jgi:hypothetical protein